MGEYVKVAKFDAIPIDSCLSVEVGDEFIALTKVGQDVLAFADVCSHDGAEIAHGKLEGEVITLLCRQRVQFKHLRHGCLMVT